MYVPGSVEWTGPYNQGEAVWSDWTPGRLHSGMVYVDCNTSALHNYIYYIK